MSEWAVEWLEGAVARDALAKVDPADWSRPLHSVFQHPLLLGAWLDSKGPAMGSGFALARLRRESSEVLVPLAVRRQGSGLLRLRRGIGVGEPHFDYQVPVLCSGRVVWQEFWPDAARALLRAGRLDELRFCRVPADRAPAGAEVDSAERTTWIDLRGFRDFDEYLASRGSNLRSDVRRRLRRCEEKGGCRLEVFGVGDGVAAVAALGRMRAAYESLHADTPSAHLFSLPGTWAFYMLMIERLLPAGLLHFSELSIGGEAAAWHFGFLFESALHWYKPTYSPKYADLGVGKVLLAELTRTGISAGWSMIDFGGGTEPYKDAWGNRSCELKHLQFWGRRPGGQALRLRHAGRFFPRRGPVTSAERA